MKQKKLKRLHRDIVSQLDEGYDLVFVDYDDKLTDEQVTAVIQQDWETVWESNSEWEFTSRRGGAESEAKEILNGVIGQWARRDDKDYTALSDEYEASEWWDLLIEKIEERDTSDPYKELAHQTGRVLMRQLIVGEDDGWSFEKVSATDVLKAFNECAEDGTALPHSRRNIKVIRDTLRECSPEFSVLLGMIVYAVDVGDLYDMGDVDYVDVVNPYVYLGNPFAGSGWCADDAIEGTFRIKRSELTTDKGAFGYGWDEVAGVVTSAYDAEIKAVPKENGEAA